MRKHSLTVLLVAGLMSSAAGRAAEPPGVIRMQDLMAAAAKSDSDNKSAVPQKKFKRGGFCTGYPGEKLRCDHLGRLEVDKIYEQGWRVVAAYQANGSTHVLFIEEQ